MKFLKVLLAAAMPFLAASSKLDPARGPSISGPADGGFEVLFSWQELGTMESPEPVTGYRVLPKDGALPIDVYYEGNRLLSPGELPARGISQKDWTPREAAVDAELWTGAPSPPPEPVPAGVMRRVGFSTAVELQAVDMTRIEREDAESLHTGEKGVRRIGVVRDVPGPLKVAGPSTASGDWTVLDDGSALWSAAITSPGAVGLRIRLSNVELESGATLLVYNGANPNEVYGPFPSTAELWTPTCFGETAVIECHVASLDTRATVAFTVDHIAHIYADFTSLPWSKAAAGACNIDLTCHPAWASTASGVGGLGSVDLEGAVWCTGSLIVDLDPCTQVPYLLTANHCIPTEQRADTLEVFWLYQTSVCNGMPPSTLEVPRTFGGSDRIAYMGGTGNIGGGNDFCLLRLRNAPPNGLTTLGWTVSVPTLATDVTCIHHPRGDFKRISFGNLTSAANPHSQWFHEVTWNTGTTEPGSSGSPLFMSATGQIVGQLWGGGASCLEPLLPDYYGRFDVTYPIIEPYLRPQTSVRFASSEAIANEYAGTLTVTVTLSAPAGSGLSVAYETADGSALAGRDYMAEEGIIEFSPGQSNASISIDTIDDLRPEQDEHFTITLRDPQCSVLNGAGTVMTVRIIDNDPDTDGDGLSDEEETTGAFGYVSDPNSVDTDRDGLSDFDEVFGTRGYQTNPSARDTDGDGVDDLTELLLGLNPLDPLDGELLSSIRIPRFQAAP